MGHYSDSYEFDAKEIHNKEVKRLKEDIKAAVDDVKSLDDLELVSDVLSDLPRYQALFSFLCR